ncbi:MAG: rhomboid family intramembrane serine protease, partial [Candidatus Binatia bacterium]
MILPLGDAPNPRGVPLVTYALIAANVAVYFLISLPLTVQAPPSDDPLILEYLRAVIDSTGGRIPAVELLRSLTAYDLFLFRHGFRPAEADLADLFASMFLHGGFLHLFGNMLFLWIYGDNVEHRLGAIPFLLAYLATGVAATVFHAAFAPESVLPMVGASGAISGVLGCYFLWFPHNTVRLLIALFPFLVDVVVLPARLLLGFYLLVDNLLPFLVTRGTDGAGVAYGAHIGGFVAGMALAWVMDRRGTAGSPREYRHRPSPATHPATAIRTALAEGRPEEAAEAYFSLPSAVTRRLLSPQDSLAMAGQLDGAGHREAALTLYRRHLRDYPSGPGAAEAHLGAGEILLELAQPTAAYQHFLEALELDPSPRLQERARAAIARIESLQKLPLRSIARRGS